MGGFLRKPLNRFCSSSCSLILMLSWSWYFSSFCFWPICSALPIHCWNTSVSCSLKTSSFSCSYCFNHSSFLKISSSYFSFLSLHSFLNFALSSKSSCPMAPSFFFRYSSFSFSSVLWLVIAVCLSETKWQPSVTSPTGLLRAVYEAGSLAILDGGIFRWNTRSYFSMMNFSCWHRFELSKQKSLEKYFTTENEWEWIGAGLLEGYPQQILMVLHLNHFHVTSLFSPEVYFHFFYSSSVYGLSGRVMQLSMMFSAGAGWSSTREFCDTHPAIMLLQLCVTHQRTPLQTHSYSLCCDPALIQQKGPLFLPCICWGTWTSHSGCHRHH